MMRKLLLVLLVLLALGAIPVQAAPTALSGEYAGNTSLPKWFNITPADETIPNSVCAAYGGRHASHYIRLAFYNYSGVYLTQGGGPYDYDMYWTPTSPTVVPANTYYMDHQIQCAQSPYYQSYQYWIYGEVTTTVNASFNATPEGGLAPLYVSFVDTSTGPINNYNWTITPESGWLAALDTLDDKDVTIYFTQPGNYTISHGVSNGYNSDIETKTDYISIFNATASNKTVYLTVMDGVSGKFVNGYTANVYDTDNSRWTNATPTDGILVITTTTGATLTANLTANGYITKVDSKALRDDDWPEDWVVTMFKTGDQPNSTNLTATALRLWVTSEGLSLPGASVQISDGQAMLTPDSGIAQFTVVNGTEYNWEVNKYPAFAGATGVITASGAVTNVNVNLIRITGTQPIPTTTGPGGSTPVPTPTLTGKALEEHNAEMDQKMMSQLRDAGPQIIDLAILVIIMSLVGMLITGFKFK